MKHKPESIDPVVRSLRALDEEILKQAEPSLIDMARFIVEKSGDCWHKRLSGWLADPCTKCGNVGDKNPTFTGDTGKVQLLRIMMSRKDWRNFITIIGDNCCEFSELIELKFLMDNSGLLLKAAYNFLKEMEK